MNPSVLGRILQDEGEAVANIDSNSTKPVAELDLRKSQMTSEMARGIQDNYESDAGQEEFIRVTEKREGASLMDEVHGYGSSIFESNGILKGVSKFWIEANSDQRVDENFKGINNTAFVQRTLAESKLPLNEFNFGLLSSATNQDQYDFFLDNIRIHDELKGEMEYLGTTGKVLAIGSMMLTDPANAAFLPAKTLHMISTAANLGRASRYATAVGANTMMQYGMAKLRQEGDPAMRDYHIALDTFFGGAIGSVVSLHGAGKLAKADKQSLLEEVTTHYASANTTLDAMTTIGDKPVNLREGYHTVWTVQKPEDTFDLVKTMGSETDSLGVKLSELEVKLAAREAEYAEKISTATREARVAKTTSAETRVAKNQTKAEKAASAKAVIAAKEIEDFQVAEATKLEARIAESGMDKTEFMARSETLLDDVKEIKDIIKSSGIEDLAAIRSGLSEEIDKIAKIDKASAESILYEIDKLAGKTSTPKKVVSTAGDLKAERGRVNYNKKVKAFSKAIANKLKPLSKQEAKALKSNVKKEKLNRLAQVKKQLDDLDVKITRGIGNEEKNLAKHSELTDVETALTVEINSTGKKAAKALSAQKDIYQRIASDVEKTMDDADDLFKASIIDDIPAHELDNVMKEIGEQLGNALGTPVKIKMDDGMMKIDGSIEAAIDSDGVVKFGKNKILLATVLAMGGSSAVMADDGSMVTFISPAFYIVGIALGVVAISGLRNQAALAGGYKELAKKTFSLQHLGQVMSRPEFKSFESLHTKVAEKANIARINSFEMVMRNGNDKIKELVSRLAYDPVNPQVTLDAMMKKLRIENSSVVNFARAEGENFAGWMGEQGKTESRLSKIFHAGTDSKLKEQFLEEVTFYKEFGGEASQFVKAQARVAKAEEDALVALLTENKVVGFSADRVAEFKQNYVTRRAFSKQMRDIVGKGGREQLVEAIARSISKSDNASDASRELAGSYLDWQISVGHGGADIAQVGTVIKAMKAMGMDTTQLDPAKIVAEARNGKDGISVGRNRIEMDLSKFGSFEVGGQKIGLSDVYERNAMNLMKDYASEAAGIIAVKSQTKGLSFAPNGVESEQALRELINTELLHHTDARETMLGFSNFLFNRQQFTSSSEMATRVANTLRDLSYARLYGTQFAMFAEHATTLSRLLSSNTYFKTQMTMFNNVLRTVVGKESIETALMQEIQNITPFGSSYLRRENTVKGIDSIFNMGHEVGGSVAEKVGAVTKNFTLKLTNMLHADDGNKMQSIIYNTTMLHHLIKGTNGVKLSANRLERYGINDSFREMFKDGFKVDAKGNLLAGYSKGWSQAKTDEYNRVIDKMVMTDSPQAIISALPHLAVSSNLGRVTAFITNFTASSYTMKFVAGATRPDAKAFADTSIYFLGTYAGIYAKHVALYGEEPEPDDVLFKALMFMPATAPYALVDMAGSGIVMGGPADAVQAMNKVSKAFLED